MQIKKATLLGGFSSNNGKMRQLVDEVGTEIRENRPASIPDFK